MHFFLDTLKRNVFLEGKVNDNYVRHDYEELKNILLAEGHTKCSGRYLDIYIYRRYYGCPTEYYDIRIREEINGRTYGTNLEISKDYLMGREFI